MNKQLAPILVFVYNRPNHVKKLFDSLIRNPLASESEVIIYSDGSKENDTSGDVQKVREYIRGIQGFKSIGIIERNHNMGLAHSVIAGVTEMINKYGRAIVLEDDLSVSIDFLEYMNRALDYYELITEVWSISGYSPLLETLNNYKKDVFFFYRASSWGWATWADRWNLIDWNVSTYEKIKRSKKMQREFAKGGEDLFGLLYLQMKGSIDSWAIRWCYQQFIENKLTVYPQKSKIINNGMDDSGTHCKDNKFNKRYKTKAIEYKTEFEQVFIDSILVKEFADLYKLPWYVKIKRKVMKMLGLW